MLGCRALLSRALVQLCSANPHRQLGNYCSVSYFLKKHGYYTIPMSKRTKFSSLFYFRNICHVSFQRVVLKCLTNIYGCDSIVETYVSETKQNQVETNVLKLWASIPIDGVKQCDLLQTLMASLIQLTTFIVTRLDNSRFWNVSF